MIHTSDRLTNMAKSLPKLKNDLKKNFKDTQKKFSKEFEHTSYLLKEIGKRAIKNPIQAKRALDKTFPISTAIAALGGSIALTHAYGLATAPPASSIVHLNTLAKGMRRRRIIKNMVPTSVLGIYVYKNKWYAV